MSSKAVIIILADVVCWVQAYLIGGYVSNNYRWQQDIWQETCVVTEQGTCVGNFTCPDVRPPLNFIENIGGRECSQVVYPYTVQRYINHETRTAVTHSRFQGDEIIFWILDIVSFGLLIFLLCLCSDDDTPVAKPIQKNKKI